MRSVLSISMPDVKKKEVMKRAKKANKTVSAYISDALQLMDQMISEDKILKRVKRARKNYKEGKVKKLRSLADLMKKQ